MNTRKYSRIELDTAPTGHTLRMLGTPGLLSGLIEKTLRISEKLNSNFLFKMFLSSTPDNENFIKNLQSARKNLVKFQFQMYDLEELFSDPEKLEFMIVTIPTELAI